MNYSYVLRFWLLAWMVYIVNNLFSGYVLAEWIGSYPAHIYRNISIIPVYLLIARYYVDKVKFEGYDPRPLLTGFIWLTLSIVVDYIFWRVFGFRTRYLLQQFMFWNGRLYSLELFALFLAPPIMNVYVMNLKHRP